MEAEPATYNFIKTELCEVDDGAAGCTAFSDAVSVPNLHWREASGRGRRCF